PQRLPGRDDRGPHHGELAAPPPRPAALRLRAPQAHAEASAGSRRRGTVRARAGRRRKKVSEQPTAYEVHHEDEAHLETNPVLNRIWHRVGVQPRIPAAGTNRRVTDFGSVEVFGRGRVEVVCAAQDSAAFQLYLDALDQRHLETGRAVFLALDQG